MWSRVAFAAAFTTLLLGTFASFGGVEYTTAGASQAYQTVKKLTRAEPVRVDRSSAADQYGPSPGQPQGGQAPAGQEQTAAGAVAQEQAGTLPFTGISLLVTVLVALMLMAAGFALRRLERRKS